MFSVFSVEEEEAAEEIIEEIEEDVYDDDSEVEPQDGESHDEAKVETQEKEDQFLPNANSNNIDPLLINSHIKPSKYREITL